MRNLKRTVILLLAFSTALPGVGVAEDRGNVPQHGSTELAEVHPLVVVVTQTMKQIQAGNGFAVGDGGLVVTAYHTLFDLSPRGQHRMPGAVVVFSPYLGDVRPAEVVAVQPRLDLAVLRTGWKGHPAFRIADTDTLLAAKHLEVVGLPTILFNVRRIPEVPAARLLPPSRQVLPVDFVAIRDGAPWFLALGEIGQLQPGWSGSPILIPGTDAVAGCFTELWRRQYGMENRAMVAQGPAVAQVSRLLRERGLGESLRPAQDILQRPEDAQEAFLASLRMLASLINDEPEAALTAAQAFNQLRPNCSLGYRVSAYGAAKLKQLELAEAMYQKALQTAPDDPSTTLRYIQYLGRHGRGDEALQQMETLWETGKVRPQLGLFFHNILAPRGEFARCARFTREALKENPRNAYLWANLGVCQSQLEQFEAAVPSYARATELFPEEGRFRLLYARSLEHVGRLDDAEKQFHRLVRMQPKNPLVHFRLAIFLATHRPESADEAIKEAEAALCLPRRGILSDEIIERFVTAVRAGTFNGQVQFVHPHEAPVTSPIGPPGDSQTQ